MADLAKTEGAAASQACENCGVSLRGRYCHNCGSRPLNPRDYSLRHFARVAFSEITDIDHSKLVRTLRALFLKPGLLSQEYFTARRVRYLKPLTLLLTIFALHIFVYSISDKVSLFSIDMGLAASPSPDSVEQMNQILERAAERRGMSLVELKENINEKWTRYFSFSQIPQVLAFALLLKLIFSFSRRHFVEHLIFAAHFYAFQVLTVVLMWPLYYVSGLRITATGIAIALGKFAVDIAYVYFAATRYYGGRSLKAVFRAILIFLAYTAVYFFAYTTAMTTALFSEAPPVKAASKEAAAQQDGNRRSD